jgi:diguanylate cyclase (GGDEF)-like protein
MRRTATLALGLIAAAGWLVFWFSAVSESTITSGTPADVYESAFALTNLAEVASAVEWDPVLITVLSGPVKQQLLVTMSGLSQLAEEKRSEVDRVLIAAVQAVQRLESAESRLGAEEDLTVIDELARRLRQLAAPTTQPDGSQVRATIPRWLGLPLAALVLVIGGLLAFVPSPVASRVAPTRMPAVAPQVIQKPERESDEAGPVPEMAPVVGLLEGTEFERAITREQYRSKRYNRPLSMLVIEIEQARQILADGGRRMLDYVLESVAELAITNTRDTDEVGRAGGDALAIVAAETDGEHAAALGAKLQRTVSLFPFDGDLHPTITISVIDATDESEVKRVLG